MADEKEKKSEGKSTSKKTTQPESEAKAAQAATQSAHETAQAAASQDQGIPKTKGKTVKVKNRWRQVVPLMLKSKREIQIRGRQTVDIPASEVTSQMKSLAAKRIIEISE